MKKQEKLSVRLERCRKSLKLSQAEFAKLLGASKRTVQNWLYGRRNPTGLSRATLEDFLDRHKGVRAP